MKISKIEDCIDFLKMLDTDDHLYGHFMKFSYLLYLANRMSIQTSNHPMYDDTILQTPSGPMAAKTWELIITRGDAKLDNTEFLNLSKHDEKTLEITWKMYGKMSLASLQKIIKDLPESSIASEVISFYNILTALGIENAKKIAEEYESLMEAHRILESF